MNPETWERAKAILGEAIEMPPARREVYVRQACEGDAQLLAEVLALLEADSPETLLHNPLHIADPNFDRETQRFQTGPESAPRAADLSGRLINVRYLVKKALGRGGFAVTYFAVDTQLDSRPVVVKVLLDDHAEDPWVLKKFQQEMRALARLDHPGVVGALDSGLLPDGRPFLVMQFVDGVPLRQAINPARGMDLDRAGNIVRQLGQALSASHQAGICHRDVKPENIMLYSREDGEEQVKLIDFGIASIRDAAASTGNSTKIAGTLAYMAPEQFQGLSSPSSDIYALGAVAYEMVTGRPPLVGENPAQVMGLHLDGVKVKPKDLRPALPEEAQAAILKALAINPADRFPRARDFGEAFVKGLASSSTFRTAPIAETREPAPRAVTSRGPLVWMGAMAIALAIAAGAWVVLRKAPTTSERTAGKKSSELVLPTPPEPKPTPHREILKTAKESRVDEFSKTGLSTGPGSPLVAGAVKVNAKDGQRYRWIPPGSFRMGCSVGDIECLEIENPARTVTITKGFWMGETEVTQEAYLKVTGKNPSIVKGAKLPVENVTWNDAQSYCQATETRLPTEAEWEYAARAGSQQSRYGELPAIAWFGGNADGKTHEVAGKAANAWGLYDTLGNVWEWMANWHSDTNPATSETDPVGPATGQYRSTRGGNFRVDARSTRVSVRRRDVPGRHGDFTGFRCVEAQPLPTLVASSTTKTQMNPRDGLVYVWIPPGTFSMGCSVGDSECGPSEEPSRQVTLSNGFWVGQTEVTQEAFQRVTGKNPGTPKGSRLPVENVSWNESQGYCSAVGLRLPTEAEWEYAARGGTAGARYGELDAVAWHGGNSGNAVHEVGGRQPNAYGLYDILGNVREWVADWYGANYYQAGPTINPSGPANGQFRVQRSAAYPGAPNRIRASMRFWALPDARDGTAGLRCAGAEIPTSSLPASELAKLARTRVNPADGLTYVLIPAGKFTMGCSQGDTECVKNESPHEVAITREFWIGQTEVTQAAYQRVTSANRSVFNGDGLPVENVTWADALSYCRAVGMRLPTEAEWEYAARGGNPAARYGDVNTVSWYNANSNRTTHPVGQRPPNDYGLFDMLGNLFEWVADWYSDGYYASSPASDPKGPAEGRFRVLRGGSWQHDARNSRVSHRGWYVPGVSNLGSSGIRCAGN